ncbi:MAG: helix-turn-helix domain-containing protein [Planctomycetes bacterium]|nr:helix-turn-helix domain-containing protein [Planctomycetota bacterium]
MAIEYYSFEQVLGELSMDEEELKRLVSEGQIRAFRDQNRMKFRRDDIDMLAKGSKAEDVVILPESAAQPINETEQDLVVMDTSNEETMLDLEGFDLVE